MAKTLHENGPCTVMYGSIYGFNKCMIENPAVIIALPESDDDIVVLYKYGPVDRLSGIYDDMREKYEAAGFKDMADALVLINFNTSSGLADYDKTTGAKLTSDEICTLINYMNNSIPLKTYKKLTAFDEAGLHTKIKELTEYGF